MGRAVAKVRTVVFAENRTSREPLCFPMTTPAVLLSEVVRGLVSDGRLTHYGELAHFRAPVITEESMKLDELARFSVLCPK